MAKEPITIDLKGKNWLLLTGHGYLHIEHNSKIINIFDSKKHYFYIKKNSIEEVSIKKFKKLNGGKVWN